MASSLLQDDTPVNSIAADELSALFTSGSLLSTAVTQVCAVRQEGSSEVEDEVAFEERSSKTRERFIALAKRYWESLPSSSTGGTVTDSISGLEAAENLVDIIWTVDQAFENGQSTAPAAPDSTQQQQPDKRAVNKLGLLVKQLNSSGILPTDLLKQRLEISLLQVAGLLTASGGSIWVRTEARTKTSLLYKQQKYNLLREESEGYSKLEVELLSSMGSPHNSRTAQPSEPLSSVRKRAESTLENIKGLIGYFDLDPARALDVILDVFADNVLYHHVFFRELLQMSPWAPKERQHSEAFASNGSSGGLLPDGSFAPIQDGANTVCAQILGFKFSWYTTAEGSVETPSERLYLMTAILIWEGLVDLPSLWPHLSPTSDEDFNKLKDKYRQEISDRIANARSNALSMAGVLGDELEAPPPPSKAGTLSIAGSALGTNTSASSAAAAQTAPAAPVDPPNARLGLLRALLSIGALKPAYWILSTYSWICEPVPEVADLLLRLLNHSISPYYYSAVSPFAHKRANIQEKQASLCQPRQRYSVADKKIVPGPSSSYSITGKPLEVAKTQGTYWREPVYFFAEWQDRLPQCQTAEEVLEVIVPMLKIIGVHAGKNREFFVHLLRIAKQETLPASRHRTVWEGIIRMHLIPALALSEPNPSTTHELWEVLRNFPYTSRFALYGEWKDRLYKRMPELRVKRVEVERDAKGMLKRLSSDNVKQFGRSLAKIAHTNPCVLFEIALNQVQSYDNLINPVVESARYLTPFGYDVLAYSLLDALSNPEKERTKSDGTSTSLWLQGLATFAGALCKRWNMEVAYILQYILNQLREGNSKDLVVLRELISKMAGIEPVSDLSDSQVVALGGGPTLQAEALHPTTAVERKAVTKRSTLRLKAALMDANLVGPLLVAVAKARQECVLGLDDAPLKYLANLFDQCQQVLFQFHDFLLSQLKAESYAKALPSLQNLWETYGLEAGIAFHVTRPGLQLAIQTYEKVRMERLREELKASRAAKAEAAKASKPTNGDVDMDGTPSTATLEDAKPQIAVNGASLSEEPDRKPSRAPSPSPGPIAGKAKSPWHPVLEDAIALAARNMPEDMQLYMTPGFFVTFWQLSLYDILMPMERYGSEVDRLNGIVRELDAGLRAAVPSYPGQLVDKAGESEKRKARDRCMQTIQELNAELKAHTEAYEATRKRLSAEKSHWFMPGLGHLKSKDGSSARRCVVQHFYQECMVPRAKLSPIDATFCSRFIRVMHNVGAVQFASLHVYDRIFSDELSPIIFSCTEGEARNYAAFLHGCLSDLTAWYLNENTYNKQAIGNNLPGFQRVWGVKPANEPIPESAMLNHSQFKTITSKWHKKMGEAFSACIESRDYMCVRNTILVLTKIAKFFPMLSSTGKQMEEVFSSLLAVEKREDLRVLALGYSALLKKQSSSWIDNTLGAQAPAASTVSQKSAVASAPSPSPAPVSSAPTTSQTSTSRSADLRSGNASPARTLPVRPVGDADRERRRPEPVRETEPSSNTRSLDRKPSEVAGPSTNGGRTPHALPARPGLEPHRRDSAQNGRQLRSDPSPVGSRVSTPVANRPHDDMQIDEPPKTRGEDRFARPAAPTTDSKVSTSRPSSPRRREAESPRHIAREPNSSPRDERRSSKDEAERSSRRRRAGSEGSSHSSQRDRKESSRSEKDRSDRREREHRSDRSDRDRDREKRSDKDRDRDRDKDKDRDSEKARRDRERPRDKDSTREREPSNRDKDRDSREKDSSRDKDSARDRDSTRDKERDRRPREPSSRSVEEKKEKEKEKEKDRPRERESRHRDSDRRADPSSARAVEPTSGQGKDLPTIVKDISRDKPSPRSDSRNEERLQQPESSTLKRSADSSNSLSELKNGDASTKSNDHDQKRRRTDEPSAPPSGPRADRQAPPPPIASLPSRPSETSIKGRASPREVGTGQGLRIKSAASAASALSSAQQHNARLQRTAGSETPKAPEVTSVPSQPSRPIQSNEERPQGLLGRLGAPTPARPREERRESPNDNRDRNTRRPGPARGRQ